MSTSSLLSGFVAKGGKHIQIAGWVFIVLSFPLMLVLVGFFMLPAGIWMVWSGKKTARNAHRTSAKVTAGMAAVGRTFRGRD